MGARPQPCRAPRPPGRQACTDERGRPGAGAQCPCGTAPVPGADVQRVPEALRAAALEPVSLLCYVSAGREFLSFQWDALLETAPLPTRGGWYAHQLPPRVQKFSTAATLVLETAVPFLAAAQRRPRQLAFALFGALQGAIIATGNYGFFNVQALVLSLWLLDDEALARVLPLGPAKPARRRPLWRSLLRGLPAVPLLALGARELLGRFELARWIPGFLERLADVSSWV